MYAEEETVPGTLTVTDSDADAYVASGPSQKRIIRLNPADALTLDLTTDDRIELVGKDGAPLRGWLICDDTIPAGTVPLDAKGRLCVGANAGTSVTPRRLTIPA